ncbi:MAG: SpaA isopeptide-forming pilin-related protein, partial [Oscillospiraceae bacterium]
QMDAKTGYRSAGFRITSNGIDSVVVTKESDGSYSFTVPDNCIKLEIIALTENTFVYDATVKKAFEPNSVKLALGDTFEFDIWTAATSSAKQRVTGVGDSTAKTIESKLEKGKKNYIQEILPANSGYTSIGFTVMADGVVLGITPETDGSYSFDVPSDAKKVEITATNRNTYVAGASATVTKVLETGSINLGGSDLFNFKVWTDATVAAKKSVSSVAVGTPATAASTFERGTKNYISEDALAGYALAKVEVKANDATIPVTKVDDSTYSFDLAANVTKVEVTVTNRNDTVQGGSIRKTFEAGSVNLTGTDTFEFDVWTGTATTPTGSKNRVSGVNQASAQSTTALKRGEKNFIQEILPTGSGYINMGFTVVTDSTATPNPVVTDEGNGVYSFTVPMDAGMIAVTAINRNVYIGGGGATVNKTLETGSVLLNASDKFSFQVWTGTASTPTGAKKDIDDVVVGTAKTANTAFVRGEKNYIQETAKTGYEFLSFEVTSNSPTVTSITLTNEGGGIYSFTVPMDASTLGVTAKNRTTNVKGGSIRKSFETGSVNLTGTDTFDFEVWTGTASTPTGSKKPVTGVGSSAVKDTDAFARGVRNYIQETAKTGYISTGFSVITNLSATPLTVTDEGGGIYSFEVPMFAETVTVTAENRNTFIAGDSASITKTLEIGSVLLNAGDKFNFQVWTGTATTPDGSKVAVNNVAVGVATTTNTAFVRGKTNYIQEVAQTGYTSAGFKVTTNLSGGAELTVTDEGGGIYSFNVPMTASSITVTAINRNTFIAGGGASMSKTLDAGNILLNASDNFDFQVWIGTATTPTGAKKDVTNVKVGTAKTGADVDAAFARGTTNYIQEVVQDGYISTGFLVATDINPTPVAATHMGNGIYSFDIPMTASSIAVTASNRNQYITDGDGSGATLKKALYTGSINIGGSDTFDFDLSQSDTFTTKTAVTGVDTTGKKVEKLERGKTYYIRETVKTGYTLDGFTVTSDSPTVTSIAVSATPTPGVYSFQIPLDATKLTITATNRNTNAHDASIIVGFEAGSQNISSDGTPDTFDFQLWKTNTSGTATAITGVGSSTAKKLNDLEKGAKYYIKQDDKKGYAFVNFTITSDSATTIALTNEGGGVYSFTMPLDAGQVEITSINRNTTTSATLKKAFDPTSINMAPNQQYTITITDKTTGLQFSQNKLKVDETATLSGLIYGRTYVLEETPITGYELSKVELLDSTSALASNQPVLTGGKWEVTLLPDQENGTIVVIGKMSTGGGLTLVNDLDPKGLPMETFTYLLTGDNGYKYYGRVLDSATYSGDRSAITWYTDAAFGSEIVGGLTNLPIGSYTLTQTSANTNFSLDRFTVEGGTATPGSGNLTFTVAAGSATVNAVANNKVKTSGSVTVNLTMDITDFRQENFTFELVNTSLGKTYKVTAQVKADGSNYTTNGLVFTAWEDSGAPVQGSLPMGNYELKMNPDSTAHFDFDGFQAQSGVTLSGDKKTATFSLSGTSSSITLKGSNSLKKSTLTLNAQLQEGNLGDFASRTFTYELYRWNGTAGVLTDANSGAPITVTFNSGNAASTVSVTLPTEVVYGRYYLVQKADDSFQLLDGTPTAFVITEGVTPASGDIQSVESPTAAFGSMNKLKSAKVSLSGYKKAPEAPQVSAVNTYTFELRKAPGGTVLYTGEVKSNAAGITTGAPIVWTAVGTPGGTLSPGGTSISGLPFGDYTMVETSPGTDFSSSDVSGNAGFGTKVSASEMNFTINAASEAMAQNSIAFENRVLLKGEIVLTKMIDGINPFPDTVFIYELKNIATGEILVGEAKGGDTVLKWTSQKDGTVYDNDKLPYGQYQLTERPDANFDFQGFDDAGSMTGALKSNSGGVVVIDLNSAHSMAALDAKSKAKTSGTLDVTKLFENNYNIGGEFTFNLYGPAVGGTIPTTPTVIKVDGTGNWKQSLTGLTFGEYEIEELPLAGYTVKSIKVNGIEETKNLGDRFKFTLGAKSGQSTAAGIISTSGVDRTGSITLGKTVTGENTLPDTVFTLTLTDGLGISQEVNLKAGEEKVFSGLLLGNIRIEERLYEDFEHTGFEVNGTLQAVNPVNVSLTAPAPSAKVYSVSKVKNDVNITITVQLTDDIRATEQNTRFEYQIYRSIDGGATWEIPSGSLYNKVSLREGEVHTYSDLPRGAVYKVVNLRPTDSTYRVRDILNLGGSSIESTPRESNFIFRPTGSATNASAAFLMDLKRLDLVVDKYYLTPSKGGTVVGVVFRLSKDGYGGVGTLRIGEKGICTFEDLTVGTYTISETSAPYRAIILQRDHRFTIYNDTSTGELQIRLEGSNNKGHLDGYTLFIPNDYDPWKGEEGGSTPDEPKNPGDNNGGGSSGGNGGGSGGSGGSGGDGTAGGGGLGNVTILPDDEMPGAAGPGGTGTGNESASDKISLPSTGGFPLGLVAILGAALFGTGAIVRRREKKGKK